MLAAPVITVDNGFILFVDPAVEQIVVNGPVAHAHLGLVGLPVEQAGGGGLVDDAAGRLEVFQKFKDRLTMFQITIQILNPK